ncbi:uncharacterized protein [Diadema setosum]|uniref:uncharacterized protein n=1 Tax=Diadema setosum TaxID=31175 RepID=UPI003B3A143A
MDCASRHFLLALVAVLVFLSSRLALKVYKFYEGRDASIDFTQSMSSDSTYEYELYLTDSGCYFCRNGTIVPGCLTPQQLRRFSVHSKRPPTDFTVTFSTNAISSEDSQIYLFAIRINRNGESYFHSQDAYIDVQRPPSPAECTVKPSEYSPAWNEVSCTSLLASDGGGSLYCFQDGEKAPYKESPVRTNDQVTQIFWMNVRLPINCCSYETSFQLTSAICSQFVYPIPTHATVSENSENPLSSQTAPIIAVPQTNAQITSSEKLSTESKTQRSQLPKLQVLCTVQLNW